MNMRNLVCIGVLIILGYVLAKKYPSLIPLPAVLAG